MASIAAFDHENVFQKIIDGVIPSYKVFETEHVLAILDAFPLVPGHALLIPKAQYATVLGASMRITSRYHFCVLHKCYGSSASHTLALLLLLVMMRDTHRHASGRRCELVP